MKTIMILVAMAMPVAGQMAFDFKSLDKLDALATNKTKVTLDADMLRLAAAFLGGDKSDQHPDSQELKSLVSGLKGVYVRTWEFDKDGRYSPSDLEPLRAYLKQQQWNMIVESQEGRDLSEVYVQAQAGDRFGGVAIVSEEPRELTVVYINGSMTLSDLEKLSGSMGIPDIDLKTKKPGVSSDKKKKDDEQEQEDQ